MENKKREHGIKWSDEYALGDERVDSQHRELFKLVADLVDSCENGSSSAHLKNTLDFLVNYTVQHFNDEEALQIKYNYPEYEAHKKLHEDFKVTVTDLVNRFSETGSSSWLSSDVNKIVVKWLIQHIMSEDKKIGGYLKK